jgi:hypothetical protein
MTAVNLERPQKSLTGDDFCALFLSESLKRAFMAGAAVN